MEGREGGTTFTACACSLLLLFHLHLLLLKQVTLSGPPRHLWKKGMKILFCCPLSRNIRQRDATAVTKPALRVVAVEQRSGADSGSSTNRMLLPPHAWRPSPVARRADMGYTAPEANQIIPVAPKSISRRAERKQSEIDAAALPVHKDALNHPGGI